MRAVARAESTNLTLCVALLSSQRSIGSERVVRAEDSDLFFEFKALDLCTQPPAYKLVWPS